MSELTSFQRYLLEWLSGGDGLYGECRGETLDLLASRGLVSVGKTPPGRSQDYAWVTLTDAGRDVLTATSASQ